MKHHACAVFIAFSLLAGPSALAQIHVVPSEPIADRVLYEERTEFTDLGDLLESVRQQHALPAIAAAVVRTDGVHAIGVAGVRSLDAPEAVTTNDPFHLGAITTTFTVTLAARMVEAGRIAFDTPLTRARAMLIDEIDPGWSRVNLGQLLVHRSGLPDDRTPDMIDERFHAVAGLRWRQRLGVCEAIFADPPEFGPGERFMYASRGYVAAAAMLEGVSAQTWEDLVQRGVADRLGLSSFGFGLPGADEIPESGIVPMHPREGRAPGEPIAAATPWGHRDLRPSTDNASPGVAAFHAVEPHVSEGSPAWRRPADGVHLSITDAARYAAFHLRGSRAVLASPTLLDPDTFAAMHADPLGQGYAMGWWVRQNIMGDDARVLAAEGGSDLFTSALWMVPEHDLAVVVLINAGGDRATTAQQALLAHLYKSYASGADQHRDGVATEE